MLGRQELKEKIEMTETTIECPAKKRKKTKIIQRRFCVKDMLRKIYNQPRYNAYTK